jgi:hypothetical protein
MKNNTQIYSLIFSDRQINTNNLNFESFSLSTRKKKDKSVHMYNVQVLKQF